MAEQQGRQLLYLLALCLIGVLLLYRSERSKTYNLSITMTDMSDSYLNTNITLIRVISELKDAKDRLAVVEKSLADVQKREGVLKKELETCKKSLESAVLNCTFTTTKKP